MTARMKKACFGAVSAVLLVIILIFSSVITSSADVEVDYSFYNLSSAASAHMNKVFSPSNDENSSLRLYGQSTSSSTGNAGTYIGYCDSEKTGGIIYGWIMSALSSSSSTYSYKTFADSAGQNAFYYYTQYGNLLNQLGLDSTAAEGMDFMRFISGGLMLIAYGLSISVVGIFSIVFSVLKFLNPFNIFVGIPKVAEYMGYTSNPNSIFASLFNSVTSWYNAIQNISWAITVPLFFIVLVLSLLLLRTANRGAKIKKYLIRIAFIAIGVPICAALYTSCLNSMSSMLTNGTSAPTKVIASTFVDFESWVEHSQLRPPNNAVLSINNGASGRDNLTGGGTVSNSSFTKLRDTCMYINAQSQAISGFTSSHVLGYSAGGSLTYDSIENTSESTSTSGSGVLDTINILIRYTSNDFYHASDWESRKNQLEHNDAWEDWFKDMSNGDNWKIDPNDGEFLATDIADKLLFDGTLMYNGDKYTATIGRKGLSTLSMYNYLSTKFTSSSVVVYSNEKSSSGFVRESHHSVNLIGGSGFMSFLYYLNAITLLGAYTVIGWFYAISMCITNLKRGIKSIASIPFALLGSIPAIAKTITYVIMLIVEIIGTFFVYSLVSELLFSINNMIEGLLSSAFNTASNIFATISLDNTTATILGGNIVMMLIIIAQSIFVIAFTVMAVKLRKSIVKTLDEFVGNFIDRLFDTNNTALPSQKEPGMLGQGAGAVAAGIGMGAGQRIGNNIMSKNAKAASAPSGTSRTGGTTASGSQGGVSNMTTIETGVGNVGGTNDVSNETGIGNTGGAEGMVDNDNIISNDNDSLTLISNGSGAGEMSGDVSGDGSGAVAGTVTNAMFSENNQEQADKSFGERVEQFSTLGGDTKEEKDEAKAVKEAESERDMQALMGQTSAMQDEQYAEDKAKAEKEAKKEAQTKAVKAVGQTLVGAGEAVAGGVSGNPELIKDGAKNTANGLGGAMDARKNARQAETNASAVAMQKEHERSISADMSNGGNGQGDTTNNVQNTHTDNNQSGNTHSVQAGDNHSSTDKSMSVANENVQAKSDSNSNLISNASNSQFSENSQSNMHNNASSSRKNVAGDVNSTSSKASNTALGGISSMSQSNNAQNAAINKSVASANSSNNAFANSSSSYNGKSDTSNRVSSRKDVTNNLQQKQVKSDSSQKSAVERGKQARSEVAQQQRSNPSQMTQARRDVTNRASTNQFKQQSVMQGQTQHAENVQRANNSVQRQNGYQQNVQPRNLSEKSYQSKQQAQVQHSTQQAPVQQRVLVSKDASDNFDGDMI